MKKVVSLLVVLCMAIVLFAGCSGGDSGTPSESASTEASASSEAPAESSEAPAESSEAPAESSAASGHQADTSAGFIPEEITIGPVDGKTEADYEMAVVYGGVNPYFDPMDPGSNTAAEALGIPAVEVQTPQNWEQNEQNQILDALIAKGKKAILMFPSNPVAGNEQIAKMVDAGIPVVCVGGAPEFPTKSTLTLATDVYASAYEGTEHLIEAMGGSGKIVALSGDLSDSNTVKRFQAINDCVDQYPDVEVFQEIGDIDNSEGSMTAVGDLLAASADEIDGMISTAYYPSVAIATYLDDEKYSHIKAVGIDTDEKVLQAIRDGKMTGTMSQNPYGQAYIATVTLKMLIDGWTYDGASDVVIDSGSFFVTPDNIADYDSLVTGVTDEILQTWVTKFTPPA